jgi:two-component system, OmpR family, alkaline phosphatase synthesis response regulator PhoP
MATVLLIDDEARVGAALRFALSPYGIDVVQETQAAAGIERARSGAPDCILLDVDLGGEDGLATCRTLKGDPLTARIPVLMLTGMVDAAATASGFEAGADDYVPKPFTPRELHARIAAHLRRAGAA